MKGCVFSFLYNFPFFVKSEGCHAYEGHKNIGQRQVVEGRYYGEDRGIPIDRYGVPPCSVAAEHMAAVISLVRQDWREFCPLYRGRFLGILVTRYVGHSSRACEASGRGQTNVDGYSERPFGHLCETNFASFTNECLTRPVM